MIGVVMWVVFMFVILYQSNTSIATAAAKFGLRLLMEIFTNKTAMGFIQIIMMVTLLQVINKPITALVLSDDYKCMLRLSPMESLPCDST